MSSATDESEEEDINDLLTSTGGILDKPKVKALPKGTLSIERLWDANIFARSEGVIKSILHRTCLLCSQPAMTAD